MNDAFALLIALGVGGVVGWRALAMSAPVRSGDSRVRAERRKWLASLAADPRRHRYAELIEAGDSFWTSERIEYDLNPNATTCCEHLAQIESKMRAAGVIVRMSGIRYAFAHCRIDADALSTHLKLPAGVGYEELHVYDRSIHDPPEARVHCETCPSSIWVKHPDVAGPDTPVFPAG